VKSSLTNIVTIARREFLWRGRGKTYIWTTILLVIVALIVALAPIVVRYIASQSGPEQVGLYVGDTNLSFDPAVVLDRTLNGTPASAGTGGSGGSGGSGSGGSTDNPAFAIVSSSDLDASRRQVVDGKLSAVLALGRSSSGELTFDLYTNKAVFEVQGLLRQSAITLAIQDRLDRLGIAPADQAAIFAPAPFQIRAAAPGATGGPEGPTSVTDFVGDYVVGFALTITIYMAIMLYGQWVAMSVAEEKNSRVMELVLGAATPFQLLSGKVLGVGALGLLQYAIVFIPASLAIAFQDRIAALVLGGSATGDLPKGLTIELLAVFGIMFVLGFGLYAVLYAGAASMVTRQEDVNQVVAPLTLLSTAGYMIAAFAGSGTMDLTSPLMRAVSFFPLVSPYLILTRVGMHEITPIEVVLAIAILLATIVAALWFAARIYKVGVLMYGQKAGMRAMLHAFRSAGS
jgi:ABC-2 type transport system permease protein